MDHKTRPMLVVVEGRHDIHFLRVLSAILHSREPTIPDLAQQQRAGGVVFLSSGGVCSPELAQQLVRLECRQFHLWDRDAPPETRVREQTVEAISALPNCAARLTAKRSLENYLHPQAIVEARGLQVTFDDQDDVAALVAAQVLARTEGESAWAALSHRARKRQRNRAKQWLNTEAVSRMTPELLHERDPQGEVIGWLTAIAQSH